MQSLHRFLDRRLVIEAMDLIQVNVVGAQAPQRRVDGLQDVLTGRRVGDPGHELAVHLEHVEWEPTQVGKRGISGAEVIHRD